MKSRKKSSPLHRQRIPFPFVLERLDQLHPVVKSMFGCYSIYIGNQRVMILRQRKDFERDNGVWLATSKEHTSGLKRAFPSLRSIEMFGPKETRWQVLPQEADDFENAVMKACDLVLNRDPRIGKIPKGKKMKR